tara:strand:+ start:152 stop:331 length:180 start_codon:yes stop_codon:yes gene_type:complete
LAFFYLKKRWLLRIFAGTIVLEEQVKKSHQDALEFIKKLESARDEYENLGNLPENKTNR